MKKLFFITMILTLLLIAGCSQQADDAMVEGDQTEADDSLDASIKEAGDLDSELVDPELDSELDSINLEDW